MDGFRQFLFGDLVKSSNFASQNFRDIAQLVARHVRDVEAGRSSRPISTKKENQEIGSLFLIS